MDFDFEVMSLWREIIQERVSEHNSEKRIEKLIPAAPKPIPKEYDGVMDGKLLQQTNKFSGDLMTLCLYDKNLAQAIQDKAPYVMEIDLRKLYELCPRSSRKKDRYDSLVRYLATIDIRLKITSVKD